jgi:hypothetical protein
MSSDSESDGSVEGDNTSTIQLKKVKEGFKLPSKEKFYPYEFNGDAEHIKQFENDFGYFLTRCLQLDVALCKFIIKRKRRPALADYSTDVFLASADFSEETSRWNYKTKTTTSFHEDLAWNYLDRVSTGHAQEQLTLLKDIDALNHLDIFEALRILTAKRNLNRSDRITKAQKMIYGVQFIPRNKKNEMEQWTMRFIKAFQILSGADIPVEELQKKLLLRESVRHLQAFRLQHAVTEDEDRRSNQSFEQLRLNLIEAYATEQRNEDTRLKLEKRKQRKDKEKALAQQQTNTLVRTANYAKKPPEINENNETSGADIHNYVTNISTIGKDITPPITAAVIDQEEEYHDTTEPEDNNASSPDSSATLFHDAHDTNVDVAPEIPHSAIPDNRAHPSDAAPPTGYTAVTDDEWAKIKHNSQKEVFQRLGADAGDLEGVTSKQTRSGRIYRTVNFASQMFLNVCLATMTALDDDSRARELVAEAAAHPDFVPITAVDPAAPERLAHLVC